ncbi:MAG: hypothetical protein PHS14_15520 [Elusimicrobia bacterium]|nr:hypothetical protein [Elusimicrobiota bacterium]
MERALRIPVSPGYAKTAQAGISAEDAARYEAALEAKDAALDACIEAMEGFPPVADHYCEDESTCSLCRALAAARKARQL